MYLELQCTMTNLLVFFILLLAWKSGNSCKKNQTPIIFEMRQSKNILAEVSFLPGCEEEGFWITEVRLSIFVCSIFMALLASESWIMLQISLQAVILSYGLVQDGGDLSPFTPSTIEIAIKQAWKDKRILTMCRINVFLHKWVAGIVLSCDSCLAPV